VWNEKSKHRLIDEVVDIALSATQIPLSIFTNLFHKRFEKAFNVGINAWNITAVLYLNDLNGDRTTWLSPFSWRFFLIHLKVYKMLPAWYSLWFNWTNSITCTHCNVTSLEHDSIPW
jgi:hypothetical protein